MSKELPFFKFIPSEWLLGEINYMPLATQGAFIQICCHYWNRDCAIGITELFQRLGNTIESHVKTLEEKDIIQVSKTSGKITIKFLDEQKKELSGISEKRTNAAKIGAKSRWNKEDANSIDDSNAVANANRMRIALPNAKQNDASAREQEQDTDKEVNTSTKEKQEKGKPVIPSDCSTSNFQDENKKEAGDLEKEKKQPVTTGNRLPPLSDFQSSYSSKPKPQAAGMPGKAVKPQESAPDKRGKLFEAWKEAGKPVAEYDRLTKPPLPVLNHDDLDCLNAAGVELKAGSAMNYARRAKVLIGEAAFSKICHEVKNLSLEGKAPKKSETARFMFYLAREVAKK